MFYPLAKLNLPKYPQMRLLLVRPILEMATNGSCIRRYLRCRQARPPFQMVS